ncbi:unnamed protein product [Dicrocoelium dendriticum]|nr:unnamed protein product [Dicrocoelium dendriticum]
MSLSFDDRVLGEKVDNYCSSSESDEASDPSDAESGEQQPNQDPPLLAPCYSRDQPQTGPKGVISDYKQFQALSRLRKFEDEEKLIEQAKKNTLACRSYNEDVEAALNDNKILEALNALDEDDEFLTQYRQNRLLELKKALERLPVYKDVYTLTADDFVQEIDGADPGVTVLVHIFEPDHPACRKIDHCLRELCMEYPHVKFCRIRASEARLSYRFSRSGIPAFVIYKRGEVIGNLLQVTRDLGTDFYTVDVENFLIERGFLPDKTIGISLNARFATSESPPD